MKLIRLESDYALNQSQFTNYLGVPLVLNKNAKCALRTLSAEFDVPPYIVDSSNDSLQFETGGSSSSFHLTNLIHGSYNIQSLCDMIQNVMNNILDADGLGDDINNTDYGFMWKVTNAKNTSGEYIITLSFNRSDDQLLDDTNTTMKNVDYNSTVDDPFFFKTNTANPDADILDSYFYPNSLVCNGGFSISNILVKQDEAQTENIEDSTWYLMLQKHTGIEDEMSLSQQISYSYAVLGVENGYYTYKKDGSMNLTNIVPSENDVVCIYNGGFSILYKINDTVIEGDDNNSFQNYLGFWNLQSILYIKDDSGKIAFFDNNITPNPFETTNLDGDYLKVDLSQTDKIRQSINAVTSEVTIDFIGKTNELLGFVDTIVSETAVSGSFIADEPATSNLFDNDVVVEINEFNTDCYDHTYKTKRNVISVVTSADLEKSISGTGKKTWQLSIYENFPVFIGLNNKLGTISFSSLTVRVSSDGLTLPLSGKMSCSLLFTDDDDSNLI